MLTYLWSSLNWFRFLMNALDTCSTRSGLFATLNSICCFLSSHAFSNFYIVCLALLIDSTFLFLRSAAVFTRAGEHWTLCDSLFYLKNLWISSWNLPSSLTFLSSICFLLDSTYASNFIVVAGFSFELSLFITEAVAFTDYDLPIADLPLPFENSFNVGLIF